jgi:hypothetical protein
MNPYGAPRAKLADPPSRPGSPYKAVALGLLTDFGGTLVLVNAIAFVYGVALATAGVPQEEIVQMLANMSTDSVYFWVGSIGGGICSVLGGYVCARVAAQSEYTLGVILAVLTLAIGFVIGGDGSLDLGLTIVLNAATVAAVMIGAWIGKKRNRAARAAAQ